MRRALIPPSAHGRVGRRHSVRDRGSDSAQPWRLSLFISGNAGADTERRHQSDLCLMTYITFVAALDGAHGCHKRIFSFGRAQRASVDPREAVVEAAPMVCIT